MSSLGYPRCRKNGGHSRAGSSHGEPRTEPRSPRRRSLKVSPGSTASSGSPFEYVAVFVKWMNKFHQGGPGEDGANPSLPRICHRNETRMEPLSRIPGREGAGSRTPEARRSGPPCINARPFEGKEEPCGDSTGRKSGYGGAERGRAGSCAAWSSRPPRRG